MTRRFTVAVRVCVNCQRTFGVSLWRWSGSRWTLTHGLCRPCHERLAAAFDDEQHPHAEAPPSTAASPAA